MARPKFITVTAPEGRKTPVHEADGVEPGGGLLYVTVDDVARVAYSQTTIRSVNRGDLIPCDTDGKHVDSAAAASMPNETDLGGKWPTAKRRVQLEAEALEAKKKELEALKPDLAPLDPKPAPTKKGG